MNVPAQRGFTLIETVIALAILALALGALYESFGSALRNTSRALWQEEAWSLAERKLVEASFAATATSSVTTGTESPQLRWAVETARVPVALRDTAPLQPISVMVTVEDPRHPARQLVMRTVAVARVVP